MLDGKRKSMQPMAARLGVDHQQLQQFVTESTWDHVEARSRIARWAEDFIRPEAYVVDDTGFARTDPIRPVWRACIPPSPTSTPLTAVTRTNHSGVSRERALSGQLRRCHTDDQVSADQRSTFAVTPRSTRLTTVSA
jgi:hypothetical protein